MIETVRTFSALSEEFVECHLRNDPVAATEAGIHDYDHLYPHDSPEGFHDRSTWLLDLEQRLMASVPWEELPAEQRVDYAILRSRLATMRADLDDIRVPARNPVMYPRTALRGLFLLMARPFAPLQERKEAILSRLMAVPEYLAAARENLQEVPAEFLTIASEVNANGPAFVEDVVRTLTRSFPGEEERIEHAGGRARTGFTEYQNFLERDLPAKVGGTYAIGERWMNFKLEREHLLGMNCDALEDFGREHVERTRRLLEDEAKRLDPARTWREQIAEAKRRHPEPLRVREAYVAEVERAKRFVQEKRLAAIPDRALDIVDTPVFERVTTPYAAYVAPAPFDVEPVGTLFVTPVDLGRRPEIQMQQLQAHNYLALPIVALHAAYPGNHLQRCHALHAGSRLRRISDSNLFSEGWALYCEELMAEQGYFLDPLTRLYQLKDQLWRACRVVLDVGLHTGRIGIAAAVEYLVEQAMLERVTAESEVRRYLLTPTQPMSYLVGKVELLKLRDEAKRRLGARFNLYDFHTALLASGTLPPALVREELWDRMGVA
jgi:Bacterial protein of unknown function (DUF885)